MAALFTLLLGTSGLLLGYFLYDFGEQNFLRETQAAIDSEMKHVLIQVRGNGQATITATIAELSAGQTNPVYLYQSQVGDILAGNIKQIPAEVGRIKEGVISFTVPLDGVDRTIAAKIHTFENGSRLLIGRDIHEIVKSYRQLKLFTSLIMVFMFIVILVSFVISTFVVKRINLIAETAKDIMDTGDLSQRISIEGDWDDLSNLAQVLNRLLAQVESLMQGVRDVSNNIAHDLRTPLTRLRNQLEAATKAPISKAQAQDLLKEADALLNVFSSLLRIARIERSRGDEPFQEIDLQCMIGDVVELYDPVAEEREIVLKQMIHTNSHVMADRDLLFQLFANLLDNAVKYSPNASEVTLSLDQQDGKSMITIADHGMGIPKEDRDKVFERFYRSDQSRNTQGCGLGLSLVKAILDQHGGNISLSDNQPGLNVTITL